EVAALTEEGIAAETPVTFATIRPQRMIDLLPRMLEPLGLSWHLDDRNVVITTAARAAKERLELRRYPIGRLLRLAAHRESQLPAPSLVNGVPPRRDSTTAELAQVLVDGLLSATSGTWMVRDGDGGNVSVVQETLLIHHNFQTHREIAPLLRAIETALSHPPGSPPLRMFETDDDAATFARLQRLLSKELEVVFTDTPLTDVAIYLSDFFEEDIVLDTEALTEEGIAPDSPVTFTGRMPFRTALRLMLEPMSLAVELRNGAAVITTRAKLQERQQTVVYDMADFLKAGFFSNDLIRLIEETTAGPWMRGDATITEIPGGLLVIRHNAELHTEIALLLHDLRQSMHEDARQPARAKATDFETRFHRAKSKQEAEALDQLIQTFVAPRTWDVSGGRGQLRTADDRLIIRQTKAVHEQIERFLREYQQAPPIGQPAK
ncbi:MAG: hypothetical protein IAG10_14170, partial [Planctomycetaceae bacterium]|nr:hypothetical protein [Planctomycetaceae bacterium]